MRAAGRTLAHVYRIPIVFIPILASLALTAWAFASPVGASPDDDFHLASIWCGSGAREGLCATVANPDERTVPRALEGQAVCYVHQPTKSAECQGEHYGTQPTSTVTTSRGNFDGTYPPVFYFVMSAFAGPNVQISVLIMRVANSALFVGLVAALFFLLPRRRRPVLIGSLVISLIPLGMFIIPSTNPSSWAMLSASILWLSLLGYFESRGTRKVLLAVLAVLGAVIGAGARADSAVYVVVAALCAVILTFRPKRRFAFESILPLVIVITAVGLYAASGQAIASSSGLPGSDGTERASALHLGLLVSNLFNIPGLWVGAFGSWGLGWFDTELPSAVWVGGFAAFVTVSIIGLRSRFRRKITVVIVVAVALWLFPAAVLAASGASAGAYVQPRYILPLIVIFAGTTLLNGRTGDLRFSRAQLWIVGIVLSITNALSLYTNIRRYVVGTGGRALSLDSTIKWWWSIPFSPMTVWAIGSLAFAGMVILLATSAISSIQGNATFVAETKTIGRQ